MNSSIVGKLLIVENFFSVLENKHRKVEVKVYAQNIGSMLKMIFWKKGGKQYFLIRYNKMRNCIIGEYVKKCALMYLNLFV